MTSSPPWADGLPIAGKPWCGQRYLKSDKPAEPEVEEIAVEEEIVAEETSTQTVEDAPVLDCDPPWKGYQDGEATDDPIDTVFIYNIRTRRASPTLRSRSAGVVSAASSSGIDRPDQRLPGCRQIGGMTTCNR
jgi:hypothetical protein